MEKCKDLSSGRENLFHHLQKMYRYKFVECNKICANNLTPQSSFSTAILLTEFWKAFIKAGNCIDVWRDRAQRCLSSIKASLAKRTNECYVTYFCLILWAKQPVRLTILEYPSPFYFAVKTAMILPRIPACLILYIIDMYVYIFYISQCDVMMLWTR